MKYLLMAMTLMFFYSASFCQVKDTIKLIGPGKDPDTVLIIKTPVQKTFAYTKDSLIRIPKSFVYYDTSVQTVFKPFTGKDTTVNPPNPPIPKTNIALNRVVTTSANQTTEFPGSLAVDGNATTRWASPFSDPQWIAVDLGSGYNIARVNILWEYAYAKDYVLQTSLNGSTWITIKTVAGNTSVNNDHIDITGKGRFVRVYGTGRGTPYGYSIYELEIYGTSDGSIPVNQPPAVNAGADQSIYLPANSVVLTGSASDNDGTISSYQWVKISGGAATIGTLSQNKTNITGLVQGTYVFQLTATDNNGAKTPDNVTVIVNPTAPSGSIKYLSLPAGVAQRYDNRSNLVIENLSFTNTPGHSLQFF